MSLKNLLTNVRSNPKPLTAVRDLLKTNKAALKDFPDLMILDMDDQTDDL